MNLWRGRQYFVAYWKEIFSRLGRVFAVSLLVFILPIFFALLEEMRPDLLNIVSSLIGIFTGAITLLGLILYSVVSSLSFAYLSAKYEWQIPQENFLTLCKQVLHRANIYLSLGLIGIPLLSLLIIVSLMYGLKAFFLTGFISLLLSVPCLTMLAFMTNALKGFNFHIAEQVILSEKPKRKQKNQLEDNVVTTESFDDDSLEAIEEESQG